MRTTWRDRPPDDLGPKEKAPAVVVIASILEWSAIQEETTMKFCGCGSE